MKEKKKARKKPINGPPEHGPEAPLPEEPEEAQAVTSEILKERDRFLTSVFESIQDGISVLDKDFTIVQVNPKMEEWYSHAKPLVGKKCYEAYHGRHEACEECPTRRALETGEASYEVVPKRGPGGEIVGWLDLYSFPVVDKESGQLTGVIEYVRDITGQKRAEEELLETRGYLAGLIESSTDAIISTDRNGIVVLFNKGAERLLGYRRDEVIGRRVTMLYEGEERAKEVMRRMREGEGSVGSFETILRAKDGSFIPVLISASLLFDAYGQEAGSVGFSKDLRERKQAEKAVREARAFYEQLVGDAGDAVVALDRNSNIITWNLGAEKIFGYKAHEVVGLHGGFLVPEEEMERARVIRSKVLAGDTVADEAVRRIGKDGVAIDGLAAYSPLRNMEGQVVGFCSIFKDVTERKRAEAAVREAQAFYEKIVGEAGDAIVVLDGEGKILTWNTGAERMFGWKAEEVLGRSYFELQEKSVEGAIRKTIERVFDGETVINIEARRMRKDGTWFDVLTTVSPLRDARGDIVAAHGILKDVTEFKQAEEALSRFARQQTVVAEIGSRALVGGNLQETMDEAVRLTADALDVEMCEILRVEEPEGALRLVAGVGWRDGLVGEAVEEVGLESQAGYTLWEGKPVVVEDLRSEKRFRGPPLLAEHGVVSGLSVPMVAGNFVYGVMGAHTARSREFSEDDVHFLEAVANMVTNALLRWEAEEELQQANEELLQSIDYIKKTQEQLVRTEKLAALGRLTAGVSHEILNPLNIITLRLHMMLEDASVPPELLGRLKVLDEQAKRISKITKDLLSFARRRPPERNEFDLNETVTKVHGLLEHQLRLQNIESKVELCEEMPPVSADQDQLQQVVLNLISNARDAMPEGGELFLKTSAVRSEGESFVELKVGDTGRGINPEHLEKLFDPFFTTKPEGQGTGLGLAICQGIIESHGGSIFVESAEGNGTTFTVHLPLVEVD